MPRVGRNPAKSSGSRKVAVEAPPSITVCLLTHAPFLAGFHADQLDVIRLAVLSAGRRAGMPVHLVVFDNGSCPEVVGWLSRALSEGTIDQLVLSRRNVGKVTAVSQLLLSATGEQVVYADGDLCFGDDWLVPLVAAATAFPEAGIVSGMPARGAGGGRRPADIEALDRITAAGAWSVPTAVERGRFVTEGSTRAFLADTGLRVDQIESRLEALAGEDDIRLRRDTEAVLLGAPHCHYLATRAALGHLRPRVGRFALDGEEDAELDAVLEEGGLLRVSVESPVSRHVGNRLTPADRHELESLLGAPVDARPRSRRSVPFARRTRVRRVLRSIHDWSFDALNEGD